MRIYDSSSSEPQQRTRDTPSHIPIIRQPDKMLDLNQEPWFLGSCFFREEPVVPAFIGITSKTLKEVDITESTIQMQGNQLGPYLSAGLFENKRHAATEAQTAPKESETLTYCSNRNYAR